MFGKSCEYGNFYTVVFHVCLQMLRLPLRHEDRLASDISLDAGVRSQQPAAQHSLRPMDVCPCYGPVAYLLCMWRQAIGYYYGTEN